MPAYTLSQTTLGLDWIHISGYYGNTVESPNYFKGSNVKIGIINDTGIDETHLDIVANFLQRFPVNALAFNNGIVLPGQGSNHDDNSVGTEVAGVVAAAGAVNLYGVAPNAKIIDYAITEFTNEGHRLEKITAAINHAMDNDVNVLIIALDLDASALNGAFVQQKNNLRAKIINAFNGGNIVFCEGTGNNHSEMEVNDNRMSISYALALRDYIVCVGSVDEISYGSSFVNASLSIPEQGLVWEASSNYGHERMARYGLVGPGTSVNVLTPGNSYATHTRTDLASAFVAGVAAVIFGFFIRIQPGIASRIVMDIMKGCVYNIPRLTSLQLDAANDLFTSAYTEKEIYIKGWNKYTGFGIVNFQILSRVLLEYQLGFINDPITNSPNPLVKEKLPLTLDAFDELALAPGWPDVGPPPFSPPTRPEFLNHD